MSHTLRSRSLQRREAKKPSRCKRTSRLTSSMHRGVAGSAGIRQMVRHKTLGLGAREIVHLTNIPQRTVYRILVALRETKQPRHQSVELGDRRKSGILEVNILHSNSPSVTLTFLSKLQSRLWNANEELRAAYRFRILAQVYAYSTYFCR